MLRWTSTRCGGFLVHWKADDHAGVWFAGLSRMRCDRYAQLCGVYRYAEDVAAVLKLPRHPGRGTRYN